MATLDNLDPEFAEAVRARVPMDLSDIVTARRKFAETHDAAEVSSAAAMVHTADHTVSADDAPELLVRAFRPTDVDGILPCFYWVPGGGYVLTSPDLDDLWCAEIAIRHRCVVVAVEWRRAPENPFPAAAQDCYAGLAWVIDNAARLRVDPARIVIGGASSGGGSAASLALMVRDRAEFEIVHQLLIYPMLDDSLSTPSSRRMTEPRLWNRETSALAWRYYLGSAYGSDDISPYAAPTRAKDLAGLAPTTMLTGELDLFVDENIAYAQRLMDSGVSTELHVYRGAPHGFFRMNPDAAVSRRFMSDRDSALAAALHIQSDQA